MNPTTDEQTVTALTRLARLFAKHAKQAITREHIKSDHRKRNAAKLRKHRRQIAEASRRRNRR